MPSHETDPKPSKTLTSVPGEHEEKFGFLGIHHLGETPWNNLRLVGVAFAWPGRKVPGDSPVLLACNKSCNGEFAVKGTIRRHPFM